MPVIVVPRSAATVAIDTFMTEESSAIRNCAAHSEQNGPGRLRCDLASRGCSHRERLSGSVGHLEFRRHASPHRRQRHSSTGKLAIIRRAGCTSVPDRSAVIAHSTQPGIPAWCQTTFGALAAHARQRTDPISSNAPLAIWRKGRMPRISGRSAKTRRLVASR